MKPRSLLRALRATVRSRAINALFVLCMRTQDRRLWRVLEWARKHAMDGLEGE